jgi:hypothetical protein
LSSSSRIAATGTNIQSSRMLPAICESWSGQSRFSWFSKTSVSRVAPLIVKLKLSKNTCQKQILVAININLD